MAPEIKFIGKNLGYNSTDYKTYAEILDELKMISVIEKINVHKSNRTMNLKRIAHYRFPRILKQFTTKDRINPERPTKRL